MPPSQIVPRLADKGLYLGSKSSFYRVFKKYEQLNNRGRMKPPRKVPEPTSFTATGPNQVWSWDSVPQRHQKMDAWTQTFY